MAEITLAEPFYGVDDARTAIAGPMSDRFARETEHIPEPFESERLPVSLSSEIQRFLRVANVIEKEEPRIAYLCRFHAFEIAHNKDKNSTGRGVRQFKTSLLNRLQQDEEFTLEKRKEKNDIRELKSVYRMYKDYILKHGGTFDLENKHLSQFSHREKLINARATASVLYEVLKTVKSDGAPQAISDKDDMFVPYNILPLDQGGIQQAIMQQPEIKGAVALIHNVRGLPQPIDPEKDEKFTDLFDFLQQSFGFQDGNVANQKEHLILLLANLQVRLTNKQKSMSKFGDGPVDELMRKFFKNYTTWSKFLGIKSNIRLPYVKQEAQLYKLLYIALYLLIWGEAANLRFMPECLCYIFHHMASELHSMLTDGVSLTTLERIMPSYGGGPESFLNNVVSPIYKVIKQEADKSKSGSADHSTWRNYDDLNEYFWSLECFQIGWPFHLDHNFFYVPGNEEDRDEELGGAIEKERERKWLGKTNFVEIRSFWQIFRSFDRMWSFFILSLQALIIMACHELGSPLQLFDTVIFEDIMSIFITSSVLNLLRAILDIAFTWKARQIMVSSQKRKYAIKLVLAVIWTIVLPVCYANDRRKYKCFYTRPGSWTGQWCFSSYVVAVMIYLSINGVELVLFLVPAVGKYIEISNGRICALLSWWTEPRLYIGRGIQESQISVLKYILSPNSIVILFVTYIFPDRHLFLARYTLFWTLVLVSKFFFSYYYEIKPLIEPTKRIMKFGVRSYDVHELFPKVKSNAGAILAVWAPIIVVYFMDTQIWYSVFCTVFGGIYGIFNHLGEIRTLGMLRSRFHTLPSAFNTSFFPPPMKKNRKKRRSLFRSRLQKRSENQGNDLAKFVLVWNQIMHSFRSEDLISNRELDLMVIPISSELLSGVIHWPVFLLANKISTAVSIAKDFPRKDESLSRKLKKDKYIYWAVKECYESLKYILEILIVGDLEKRIISALINEIEESIQRSTLLMDFKMTALPALLAKIIEFIELLVEGNEEHREKVVRVLQDIFELVIDDMITDGSRILDLVNSSQQIENDFFDFSRNIEPQLFESSAEQTSIHFPLPDSGSLHEQVKRFLMLLTVKDTAMDVPENLEARRRLSFLATSIFMNVPSAPLIRNMMSFSVLTPYYLEDINFSLKELHSSQQEVSIIFYMQKIFPDEWKNFLERMGCENLEAFDERQNVELRNWASFRGQTLCRTVRGIMYYREALKLQAFLDMAEDEDILEGYETIERGNPTLSAQLDALADMKFTYVVSCQAFGTLKANGDQRADDIVDLMERYPCLRVAYVEEREDETGVTSQKIYSSKLVKIFNGFDQEIYSIKLPGQPNVGEGKPENQNHAIIFTRGEALQTIDMNQECYLEEAFKMRNLLEEFLQHNGHPPPTIIGLREHIFTGSVSSLAWFMSYQETSFVTIGQRILANPLRVRFHYGHPDVFDRVFHITRGGVSKASKTINLSEDVYAGFNSTLRRGRITYHEYMQVGKGRDVGLNQISKFEAKVSNGNSEQTISRDVYRLGHRFDFFRMLSCYYTTIGFYFSSLVSVLGIYVFLYGQLYLVLSGLERALLLEAKMHNIKSLETALASQSFIQLGLLTGLPMVMEIGLEKGFLTALKDFVLMQLQLAAVFFTFSLGTKVHYYGRTIIHGGAKYRPTGRKVVIFHASFTENYRLYSRSHFIKGFELLLLLIIYDLFRRSYQNSMAYVLITYSIWFMSITWLFAPFLFNPAGFSWGRIVDDWKDWNKWMRHQGGIGIQQDKSWHSWWDDEQAHLRNSGLRSRLIEILLSLRFFMYQYGLVYHLDISRQSQNFLVYVLSWVVIVAIFLLVKAVNMGRQQFSANYHFAFRIFKAFLFLGVVSVIITLSIICDLSFMDLVVCCLGFLPTGWGLILISQAMRPKLEKVRLWGFARVLAKSYDYGMGIVLFAPVAVLAWLPAISAFQTRFLFNEAFNRHLQIQPILPGKKKQT